MMPRWDWGRKAILNRQYKCKIGPMDAALFTTLPKIRQIRTRRDIAAVADLIELCFANTMDRDGREYVRYLRKMASGGDFPFISPRNPLEGISYLPVRGFVWEEDGLIVGNLSLIYIHRFGRLYALIANVATHPEYRRRGIARDLTLKALNAIQSQGLSDAWLHVRDDNPAAEKLYQTLGFEEQFRRTQWQWEPGLNMGPPPELEDVKIEKRTRKDWQLQESWLDRVYPPEIAWNLALEKTRLRPSLQAAIKHYFSGGEDLHLAARHKGHLIGVLSRQSSPLYSDNLWLGCDPQQEVLAGRALLTTIADKKLGAKPLALNYPAGKLVDVVRLCGFYPHLTLIWMRKTFNIERK